MNDRRVRGALELGLRMVALASLLVLIVYAFHALRSTPSARALGTEVDSALIEWSTRDAPGRARVDFETPASPEMRDWLAALAAAGTEMSWGGAAPPPSALAVEPVADPRRPSRVWLAAPAGTDVRLHDALGDVDSANIARRGARVLVPKLSGALHAVAAEFEAKSALRDSLVLRPILVLGQAGWEAKFTIAALEEHGWEVEARLAVAPSGDVRQGADRVAIDTARYAAVIAIDSVAARYRTHIIRYVRDGGALIAAGEAADLGAFAPVLPARVIAPPSLPSAFTTDAARAEPRTALALAPLGQLDSVAVPLEARQGPASDDDGDLVAAAAWRVGEGRVLQIGYRDIWRWRMAGDGEDDDGPVRAHREWWAALVSSVAYAPRVALPASERLEPTPLASLIATLGPAAPRDSARASLLDDPRLLPVLFGLMMLALLLEWLSRRLRGER